MLLFSEDTARTNVLVLEITDISVEIFIRFQGCVSVLHASRTFTAQLHYYSIQFNKKIYTRMRFFMLKQYLMIWNSTYLSLLILTSCCYRRESSHCFLHVFTYYTGLYALGSNVTQTHLFKSLKKCTASWDMIYSA